MTPKQRAAIKEHGRRLLATFPNATERDPVNLCRKLRRLEVAGNARCVRECNEDVPERERERWRTLIKNELRALLGPEGERVWINGDPRGYTLKVHLRNGETLHRDWGGYGIIAPEIDANGC